MHLAINIVNDGLGGVMSRFDSKEARVMLYAIGLQESRFVDRRQIGGPARGFWQFERGGGVAGVLAHPSTKRLAEAVCTLCGVIPSAQGVYYELDKNDALACAFARLLLYTDARSLPKIGDADAAWDYYRRNWRPGRPHRATWDELYSLAVEAAGAL